MFDDIEEDSGGLPDLITTDVVIEECNDVVEEEADQEHVKKSDDIHLIPVQKTRRRVRSRHSEDDSGPNFNQVCGEGSIYTTPSMFSLISIPNKFEDNTRINMVGVSSFNLLLNCCAFTILLPASILLMWYQKKRELMEQFLQKHTYCFSRKD